MCNIMIYHYAIMNNATIVQNETEYESMKRNKEEGSKQNLH